jgi:hypothetical protein
VILLLAAHAMVQDTAQRASPHDLGHQAARQRPSPYVVTRSGTPAVPIEPLSASPGPPLGDHRAGTTADRSSTLSCSPPLRGRKSWPIVGTGSTTPMSSARLHL